MAERIVPATPSLAMREQRAINDLRALFPDGNVSGLDRKDSALADRLTTLYHALGYASRKDMIEALGFKQVRSASGGRPVSVVPDELFEELARRYEGKPKPKSLGIIKHDNPDLAGKIKTVNNKCTEVYGHTMAVELIQRGLLDRKLPPKSAFGDDDIRKAVSELKQKYAATSEKPKTVVQLKKLEPEYAAVLDSLTSVRSRSLFGMTRAAYLKKTGILAGDAPAVDDDAVCSTLESLQKHYRGKPNDQKPKTVKTLIVAHPEYADALKAGQKSGIVTRESLLEREILGLSKKALANKAKLLKQRCARNATVQELARLYGGAGGAKVVLPSDEDGAGRLRPGVVGIDLDVGYELRETTLVVCDADLAVGDELSFTWKEPVGWIESRKLVLVKDDAQVLSVLRSNEDDFLDYRSYDVESPLADSIETVVTKMEKLGEHSIARIRHRFIAPISCETMLYALYRMDALKESELYENDDSWRDRLDKRPEDTLTDVHAPNEQAVDDREEDAGKPRTPHDETQDGKDVSSAEAAIKDSPLDEHENNERQAIIATLKLLVLMGGMASGIEYPQDMLDELERAENGDTSVDLEDLAKRFNEFTPDFKSVDLSNVSFSQCRRAKGRRFSIAIPDGWSVIEDYEEKSFLGTTMRPFVAIQGSVNDPNEVQSCDRIIYSTQRDIDVEQMYAEFGIYDLRWAIMMNARYDKSSNEGVLALRPTVVWDEEVDAVNTRCFLSQNKPNDGANGLEIYIAPYALDHGDFIRLVLTYQGEESVTQARELARALARTVELDKPIVPTCEQMLVRAVKQKVSVDEFCKMVESYAKPYIALRQSIFQSHQYKYATTHKDFSDNDVTLAGAQGIAELDNRAVSVLSRIVDAYDNQVLLGAVSGDRKKMLDAMDTFDGIAFPTPDIFEEADSVALVKSAHVFDPTEELMAVRGRLAKAKEELASSVSGESKISGAKPAKAAATGKATASKPAKKRRARAPKADEVLAALNELCDADTFVDSKELASAMEGEPTANQVHKLLVRASEESKVRRVSTGRKFLFSRLLTDEEWADQLGALNRRFEEEDARRKDEQKEKRLAGIRAQLDKSRSELDKLNGSKRRYEQRLKGYERGLDVATRECEILRTSQSEAMAEVSRLEDDVSSLGFFAVFRKKELKNQLEVAREKSSKLQENLKKANKDFIVARKRRDSTRSEIESLARAISSQEAEVREMEESLAVAERSDDVVELSAEEKRQRIAEVAGYWGLPVTSKWCADNVSGITVRAAASALGIMSKSEDASKLADGRYSIERPMPFDFVVAQITKAVGRGAYDLTKTSCRDLALAVELYDAVPLGGPGVTAATIKMCSGAIQSLARINSAMNVASVETGYIECFQSNVGARKTLYRKLKRPNL